MTLFTFPISRPLEMSRSAPIFADTANALLSECLYGFKIPLSPRLFNCFTVDTCSQCPSPGVSGGTGGR